MKNKRNDVDDFIVNRAIVRLEAVRDSLILKMSKGTVQAQSYLGLVSTANKDIDYLMTLLNTEEVEKDDTSESEVVTEPDKVEVVPEPDKVEVKMVSKGRPKGSTNKNK